VIDLEKSEAIKLSVQLTVPLITSGKLKEVPTKENDPSKIILSLLEFFTRGIMDLEKNI